MSTYVQNLDSIHNLDCLYRLPRYLCTLMNAEFFKNKIVAVTGGTDGIGKALVNQLIAVGAKVSTCGRSQDKLYAMKVAHAEKPFVAVVADVSRELDCRLFVEHTVKMLGGIDILINNAGISMRALFEETELNTIRQVMEINFWGTVATTHFALPYIIASKGSIVGISSIAGFRGLPGRTGYSASKFALNGFMESLRTEMFEKDVNVLTVCPGFTASNIRNAALNKSGQPQGESPMAEEKMMTADEVATNILNGIEKRKRLLVMTAQGKQTVWLNRLVPAIADKLVHKFFYKNGKLSQ